ncbi:MAG: hypothetical protein GTO02_08820, partial [Candidatus Dadabacteria bacterium]|nr:hypothetical protein [Candidatus Dadabacteria bacterium]
EDMDDMDDDDMDDEEDMDDEDMGDMGDEGEGDMGPLGAGSPPPGMGGPMAGGEMGGPLGGPMGGPPMGKKKPMPPKMMGKSMYMKKEAHSDPTDDKMKAQNKRNDADDQKCCPKCKKCAKMAKEETENTEFNDSLKRQTGGYVKFKQDELGFWVPVTEDVLIAATQQEQPTETEPQAGEVGFAPQQKIGIVGSNFQEWVSQYTNKPKKNRKKSRK